MDEFVVMMLALILLFTAISILILYIDYMKILKEEKDERAYWDCEDKEKE